MKKNLKRALVLSTTLSASATAVVGVATHNNQQDTKNIQKRSSTTNSLNSNGVQFNNKTYTSINDAVNDFLTTNGTVTQKLYLGDVNSATSSNDYNTINLNDLKEVKDNNLLKAYKTLTDDYTSNLDSAKKSYLQNPVIKWQDRNGNQYDSEYEARYAIQNNSKDLTNSVAYYEIKDYSNKDKFGNPTIVKINPLNENDLNKLKTIAAKNAFISGSDFSLERYSVNPLNKTNLNYENSNSFAGYSNDQITKIVNDNLKSALNAVRDNLWLNTRVDAVSDTPVAKYSTYTFDLQNYYQVVTTEEKMEFETLGYNPLANTNLAQIKNDAKYFYSGKETWKNKFNITTPGYSSKGLNGTVFDAIKELKSNGQTVLGGQKLDFQLKDGENFYKKHTLRGWDASDRFDPQYAQYFLHWNDISFLGNGKRINANFKFNVNQAQVDSMLNNTYLRQQYDIKKIDVRDQVHNALVNIFKQLGLTSADDNDYAWTAAAYASDLLTKDVLGKDGVESDVLYSDSSLDSLLDGISAKLVQKLDETLSSYGFTPITTILENQMKLKYQVKDSASDNNTIYTISYNGVPLYKLDNSVTASLISNPDFNANPLDYAKKYIANNLNQNYNQYINTLTSGMINVSNSFKIKNGNLAFSQNAIDNYANANDGNFNLDNNTVNNNGFDSSVKLFSEQAYTDNGIDKNKLQKQLNRREQDEQSNLLNPYGTFEAIYQYNQNLSSILNNKDASQTLKDNVNKNALKNPNNVVVLYTKDKKPENIKYGEYLNYGYKFNESLSDNTIKVFGSQEKRKYEISSENLDVPTKNYTYFDYNGNVLLSETVDAVNGSYDVGAQQVYLNALNQIVVPASSEYVYYVDQNGNKELVKNQTTKLNVLTIVNNGKTYQYGFKNYNDLYNYAANYIKINAGLGDSNNNNSLFNRSNTPAILSGFYAAFGIIILAEVVVMSYIFVKNNKNFNISTNNRYNFSK